MNAATQTALRMYVLLRYMTPLSADSVDGALVTQPAAAGPTRRSVGGPERYLAALSEPAADLARVFPRCTRCAELYAVRARTGFIAKYAAATRSMTPARQTPRRWTACSICVRPWPSS